MSVNKVILLGRLGQDPELRYTASGKAVCNFSIATSNKWKDKDGNKQERTEWHNITAWEKQGEVIKEYILKGDMIYLEGELNYSLVDKDDRVKGLPSCFTNIKLTSFSFVGGSRSSGDDSPQPKDNAKSGDLPF